MTHFTVVYLMVIMLKQSKEIYLETLFYHNIFPVVFTDPNDDSFGLQPKLKCLSYAGIETKAIGDFVSAVAKNRKRKKYKLGDVKKAVAKNPGSNDTVYEVIYVDVIDPAEPELGKGKTAKDFITSHTKQNNN